MDITARLAAALDEARAWLTELEGRLASYHCAQAGLSCRSDFPPAGAKWTPYCEVHNIRAERDRAIEQAAELEAELAGLREREKALVGVLEKIATACQEPQRQGEEQE